MTHTRIAGAILKLLRAGDHQLTVTDRDEISPHYLRLSFSAGGLLDGRTVHPTTSVRMWFADGDSQHQRAYTLVNPDPANDTVDIDFALRDGIASGWARQARPGDTVAAGALGGDFIPPEPTRAGYVIVGDTTSLPAVNSLLHSIGDAPARVFLEATHYADKQLPVARNTGVVWVDRKNAGESLVQAVADSAFDAPDQFGWVASDNRTTRAVARMFREQYRIPRRSIRAQAYWVA